MEKKLVQKPLVISYESDAADRTVHYLAVYVQGTNQIIEYRRVALRNGETVSFLHAGINYDVKLYEGSSAATALVETVSLTACSSTAKVKYKVPPARPKLYFDLATVCNDGTFRYTGPIDYKLSGTSLWMSFRPSKNGILSTTLHCSYISP